MVEQRGIEPLTSALRTRRSAKLSYCPTRTRIQFQLSGFKFQVCISTGNPDNAHQNNWFASRMLSVDESSKSTRPRYGIPPVCALGKGIHRFRRLHRLTFNQTLRGGFYRGVECVHILATTLRHVWTAAAAPFNY